MKKYPIPIIFGPTASGKTGLAIALAKNIGGEVVSADSQQIYSELFIGTARPTEEEMQGVRHHLIGHVSVREKYNVARFIEELEHTLKEITERDVTPIICGGSYMWIGSILDGLSPTPPSDVATRKRLEEASKNEDLYDKLEQIDPESARRIDKNDTRRIVRALEIFELSGKTRTEIYSIKNILPYKFFPIGIMRDREKLYSRINTRVDEMLEEGLLDEIRNLVLAGLSDDIRRVKAHGYPPLLDWHEGKAGLEEAIETMKKVTRNYAKRQISFLKGRADFVIMDNPTADLIIEIYKKEVSKWTTKEQRDIR
ncbi:MAG TPA: tRNA (adenosine(37)-N6)-dimethylallyltransferase MiaA [Caldisericia bacterium]|nr:tRNA (adenosine(37)-N6)-dimethylallyltransferase MiaA [Caldisericia bacterium]HPF48481.1 tRNA (adenosine(37)-N6)-dimethylallyltransferase MiaA [Caldisericia bacterium]HPI83339.1 tRNA (adenosine(37)-N6)-dimethylallyltransferase MiaA [Caldisericia bacterium]HPQ92935.1 tRNA (adenosine(37)-N6)-dimethylallyltransferase MiaA [Caldisericia bacterium]HRV73967.1 tRNA (adenosine(37)-N6)-dimethylallyltransferase MiaA [Caldisericia bacterium]